MMISLGEIAELVEGRLSGDPLLPITGTATIRDAIAGQITLVDKQKLIPQLLKSSASAAIVAEGIEPSGLPFITVGDVHRSFAKITTYFQPPRARGVAGISPRAEIHETASIGEGCDIHSDATIGEGVVIGKRSIIHPGVRIMSGCRIGDDVTIFPNTVLYENTVVGDRSILHAGAVIGGYGFGYETVEGAHRLSAQLGNVEIGHDVEIGSGTTIDRGTYGPTTIGDGTKIDNLVMIAHNCRIGRHNIICSQVGIAGSCLTGDYVIMAGQVGIRDHITIGERAIIGAQAGVMSDVPAGAHYLGSPAMPEREQMHIFAAEARLPEMRRQLKALQRTVDELVAALNGKSQQDAA